jgi:hypothetical protein
MAKLATQNGARAERTAVFCGVGYVTILSEGLKVSFVSLTLEELFLGIC